MQTITQTKQITTGHIVVEISIADDCKNGHSDFSITASEYSKSGRLKSCGCLHDEILEYFPEYKTIIDLHLSDVNGVPMYAVENGMYRISRDIQAGINYLRCNYLQQDQKDLLVAISNLGDSDMFYSALVSMGVFTKRKQEADDAIKLLGYDREEAMLLQGRILKNKIVPILTIKEINNMIKIKKQINISDRRIKLHKEYIEQKAKTDLEYNIKYDMIGITTSDNWIYYAHKNVLQLNRMSSGDKFPEGQIEAVTQLCETMGISISL